MPQASSFEIVNSICHEAEAFDTKDRLLNFSTKGEFQTPLMLEAGDFFYEKWAGANGPLALDAFLPLSASFTAQQKKEVEDQFRQVFKSKSEDFLCSDLYLLLGFLKWDGNALAPSLLVPIDVNPDTCALTISKRSPLENIILRKKLSNTVQLPKVEDAIVNGKFSILLYFSLFEKAVAAEKNWKFTRHGLSLAFFNTHSLRLKKRLEKGFNEKDVSDSTFITSLFGDEGFPYKETIFGEKDFDQVYNPADYHFLYPTDSHSTKVTIDALDENSSAYAIQALPGTDKNKVLANVAAELVARKKRTLVVARRAVSKLNFLSTLQPMFRSFNGPERDQVEAKLRPMRDSLVAYYKTVTKNLDVADAPLSSVLNEFIQNPAPKSKFAESTFQGVADLTFEKYHEIKGTLDELVRLYFEEGGIEARKAFEEIKVPSLDEASKESIAKELQSASTKVEDLTPIIKLFESIGLFPTGIYLSGLADVIDLIRKNFSEDTPEFEQWELRSNNWVAYQDSLKALPEAGDKWVRFRRQTSDIYVDGAVDENILATREEFAESLKATLKGLSDHYRSSRKRLLSVLKNPKDVTSDEKLLDLIDTLIDLQENKRAYKDTSVLGNHLLGKDWLYEKSNWVELNRKIQYLYQFRETHEKDPRLDLQLLILESWHIIKPYFSQLESFSEAVQGLLASVRKITRDLGLDTPLESLCIDKWLDEIKSWNANWANLDIHLQISSLLKSLEESGCKALASVAGNTALVNKDLSRAFAFQWSGSQIQSASKSCTDLFSLSPKARAQKNSEYRSILDQLFNANFRDTHGAMEQDPELLKLVALDETFSLNRNRFDVVIFLDADCISVAEALPSICATQKTILVGDPHMPAIEHQLLDAYSDSQSKQSAFFQGNILAAALRKGIPTRELWFANSYADSNLVNFANAKIYGNGIKQLPKPSREKSKNEILRIVPDKIMSIAKAAITHAEKRPGQTLGIIAFHQARCLEIEAAIKAMLIKDSAAARFFSQTNPTVRYYIKTPDRVADKYRDTIFICSEAEGNDKPSSENKFAVCTTLAKQDIQVFVSESDMSKQSGSKQNLFWNWIEYLQKKAVLDQAEVHQSQSILKPLIVDVLKNENFNVEDCFASCGIAVGPVVVDANNSKRFLAVVEDDCTTERFRESVEDRAYIRPTILKQAGWKIINLWLPFWYMANQDEKDHLITTIAIEQSVAPPPPEEDENEKDANASEIQEPEFNVEQYQVLHPKIEGTAHDKPIAELPAASIITQLKFYVDHEAPIHEELLLQRILELHHVDRAGPMLLQALNEAIKQGFQKQRFIKTGKFFYSIKNNEVVLRNRGMRPDSERKMTYVSPEERALLPTSMDEATIKQTLGLLD